MKKRRNIFLTAVILLIAVLTLLSCGKREETHETAANTATGKDGTESQIFDESASDPTADSDFDLTGKAETDKPELPEETDAPVPADVTVSDALNYSKDTVQIFEGAVTAPWDKQTVIIPKIDSNAPGAEKLNEEILGKYYPVYETLRDCKEENRLFRITYDFSKDGSLIIICVRYSSGLQASEFITKTDMYFYDSEKDARLTVNDALGHFGIKEEKLREYIQGSKRMEEFKSYAEEMLYGAIKDYDKYTIDGFCFGESEEDYLEIFATYSYQETFDGETYDLTQNYTFNVPKSDYDKIK